MSPSLKSGLDLKGHTISACFSGDTRSWCPRGPGTKADYAETTMQRGHGTCSRLHLPLSPAFGSPSPSSRHTSEGALLEVDPPAPLFPTQLFGLPQCPSPMKPQPKPQTSKNKAKLPCWALSKFPIHICELTKTDVVLRC